MFDHLAADAAGLAAGELAVVAVLEVHADRIRGLHLELVHRGLGLGDVQLVAVLGRHNTCTPFIRFGRIPLLGYRKRSISSVQNGMQKCVW